MYNDLSPGPGAPGPLRRRRRRPADSFTAAAAPSARLAAALVPPAVSILSSVSPGPGVASPVKPPAPASTVGSAAFASAAVPPAAPSLTAARALPPLSQGGSGSGSGGGGGGDGLPPLAAAAPAPLFASRPGSAASRTSVGDAPAAGIATAVLPSPQAAVTAKISVLVHPPSFSQRRVIVSRKLARPGQLIAISKQPFPPGFTSPPSSGWAGASGGSPPFSLDDLLLATPQARDFRQNVLYIRAQQSQDPKHTRIRLSLLDSVAETFNLRSRDEVWVCALPLRGGSAAGPSPAAPGINVPPLTTVAGGPISRPVPPGTSGIPGALGPLGAPPGNTGAGVPGSATSLPGSSAATSASPSEPLADPEQLQLQQQQHLAAAQARWFTRQAEIQFLELSFRNQYIGRSDMWRITEALEGEAVQLGQQALMVGGMRLCVDEMSVGGPTGLSGLQVKSGLITRATKVTYRSQSARLFLLVQLSSEMWDFAMDGELFFEKILGFLRILFLQWQVTGISHYISIILFSRTIVELEPAPGRAGATNAASGEVPNDTQDHDRHRDRSRRHSQLPPFFAPELVLLEQDPHDGSLYQDHYKVVVETESQAYQNNWDDLLCRIRRSFHAYWADLRWDRPAEVEPPLARPPSPTAGRGPPPETIRWPPDVGPEYWVRRRPSTAARGNILEAVNCAMSVYDKHYIDRDLNRTGQNIVLLTAGSGRFHVSGELARLTKQRMVDHGIGCDLISMARAPMHAVPLFCYKEEAAVSAAEDRLLTPHHDHHCQFLSPAPDENPELGMSATTGSATAPAGSLFGSAGSNTGAYGLPHGSRQLHRRRPGGIHVPNWMKICFYDHQDLYDSPFGSMMDGVVLQARLMGQHPGREPLFHSLELWRTCHFSVTSKLTLALHIAPVAGSGAPSAAVQISAVQRLLPPELIHVFVADWITEDRRRQPSTRSGHAPLADQLARITPVPRLADERLVRLGAGPSPETFAALSALWAARTLRRRRHSGLEDPDSADEGPGDCRRRSPARGPLIAGGLRSSEARGLLRWMRRSDALAWAHPGGTERPQQLQGHAPLEFPGARGTTHSQYWRDPFPPAPGHLANQGSWAPTGAGSTPPAPSAPGRGDPGAGRVPDQDSDRVQNEASDQARVRRWQLQPPAARLCRTGSQQLPLPPSALPASGLDSEYERWAARLAVSRTGLLQMIASGGANLHSWSEGGAFAGGGINSPGTPPKQLFRLRWVLSRQQESLSPPADALLEEPGGCPGFVLVASPNRTGLQTDLRPADAASAADPRDATVLLGPHGVLLLGPRQTAEGRSAAERRSLRLARLSPAELPSLGAGEKVRPVPAPCGDPRERTGEAGRIGNPVRVRPSTAPNSAAQRRGGPKHRPPPAVAGPPTTAGAREAASGKVRPAPLQYQSGSTPAVAGILASAGSANAGGGGGVGSGGSGASGGGNSSAAREKSHNKRRWRHLYATIDEVLAPLIPNWKSLCKPAILPLTTDVAIEQKTLDEDYYVYSHQLFLLSRQNYYGDDLGLLLREVFCQRTAQDYQLVLNEEVARKQRQLAKLGRYLFVFSVENQVHEIVCDPKAQSILVTRFVLKRSVDDRSIPAPIPYRYLVWNEFAETFVLEQREIAPNRDDFDWNAVDSLLAGDFAGELFQDNIKYRRLRFAIIPSTVPAGPAMPSAVAAHGEHAGSTPAAAAAVSPVASGSAAIAAAEPAHEQPSSPATSSPGDQAAERFQRFIETVLKKPAKELGITLSPHPFPHFHGHGHAHHLSALSHTAAGSSEPGYLWDAESLERQTGFAVRHTPTRSCRITLKEQAELATEDGLAAGAGVAAGGAAGAAQDDVAGYRRQRRRQWIQVQHDTRFWAGCVFYLEVMWVVASGIHVENWIASNLGRKPKAAGLRVVKVPCREPVLTSNAFQVNLRIPLPNHPACFGLVEQSLLSPQLGFVWDEPPLVQGHVLVRLVPGRGLIWVLNHLLVRPDSPRSAELRQLFQFLRERCFLIGQLHDHLDDLVHEVASGVAAELCDPAV